MNRGPSSRGGRSGGRGNPLPLFVRQDQGFRWGDRAVKTRAAPAQQVALGRDGGAVVEPGVQVVPLPAAPLLRRLPELALRVGDVMVGQRRGGGGQARPVGLIPRLLGVLAG